MDTKKRRREAEPRAEAETPAAPWRCLSLLRSGAFGCLVATASIPRERRKSRARRVWSVSCH